MIHQAWSRARRPGSSVIPPQEPCACSSYGYSLQGGVPWEGGAVDGGSII